MGFRLLIGLWDFGYEGWGFKSFPVSREQGFGFRALGECACALRVRSRAGGSGHNAASSLYLLREPVFQSTGEDVGPRGNLHRGS